MKPVRRVVSGVLLTAVTAPALADTIVVTSLADNGPGNCTATCTLRDAIARAMPGDTIEFGINLPWTIVLNGTELPVTTPVSIVGPGAELLSVSANNQSRVLNVSAAVSISGLTLRDGSVTGGNGGKGGIGFPGVGGGDARGGCVYLAGAGQLTLSQVAVTACGANGGVGGKGGEGHGIGGGMMGSGFPGGAGGPGGSALGAVFSLGDLAMVQSSVTGCALTGGAGGQGGTYGYGSSSSFAAGSGGLGGAAYGGGIYAAGGTLLISNSTVGNCTASGGPGGAAGSGATQFGGNSGLGGPASGGSVFIGAGVLQSDVEFSTLTGNTMTGGDGGTYPSAGPAGAVVADAFDSVAPSSVMSSIIASVSANADCAGSLSSQGANFDQNSTCAGFSLHGSVAQTLASLSAGADGTFSYMPVYAGAVIDAASNCTLLDSSTLTADQHGTARPQGSACDLGAIEADYIFVNGFE